MIIKKLLTSAATHIAYQLNKNVNPRTIEFGLHFLLGSQKGMTLNSEEIKSTKLQIKHSMEKGFAYGQADIHSTPGCKGQVTETFWFTNLTAGVVGGFDFNVEKQNDKVICHCYDTWDFNSIGEKLSFTVDYTLENSIKLLAKKFKVNFKSQTEGEDVTFFITEAALFTLNEKHSFVTKWDVEFSLEEWKEILSNK